MYRRLEASLPKDPYFPADLKELGYFINNKSQIKSIKNPDEGFRFKITDHERFNVAQREAMNECIRREVIQRSIDAGLNILHLPQLSITKPKEPHVPILATPQDALKTKKRVYVVINDHRQDLGIWDYRFVDRGIDVGSTVNLARVLETSFVAAETGLLVLNPGQLNYSHKKNQVMTLQTWDAQRKESRAHPNVMLHPVHNAADDNRTNAEHIAFSFEKILKDSAWIRQDAEIYVVGILNGGEAVLSYLNANWEFWSSRIAAIALTSVFTQRSSLSWPFVQFLRERARNWKISSAPKNACLVSPLHWVLQVPDTKIEVFEEKANDQVNENGNVGNGEWGIIGGEIDTKDEYPDPQVICPEFSSSIPNFTEAIFPTVLDSILSFFKDVENNVSGYKNPAFKAVELEPEIEEEPIQGINEKDADMFMSISEEVLENDGDVMKGRPPRHVVLPAKKEVIKEVNGQQTNGTEQTNKLDENADGTTFAIFNPLDSRPIQTVKEPPRPQTDIAGIQMNEETLRAAGLL